MNKWVSRIMVVALALVALSARTVAMAGEAEPFSFHNENKSANAAFSSVDAGITTVVDISVSEDRSHFVEEGEPGMLFNSSVGVIILQSDSSGQLLNASGFAQPFPDEDFNATAVSPGAAWTLNTTVEVFDSVSNSLFDVFINLTWTCTGAVERSVDHPEPGQFPPGEVDRGTVRFADCSAEATGSVVGESTDFTPGPSVEGHMATEDLVEIEVSHP